MVIVLHEQSLLFWQLTTWAYMSLHLPLAVAFPYWFMPLRLVPLRAEVVAAVVVAAVVVAAVVVAAVVRPFKEDQEQAGDINFPIIIKAKST